MSYTQTFKIVKGRDIKIQGAAQKKIVKLTPPKRLAVQPSNFQGLKLRLSVKEGDQIKLGSTLLTDKINADIKILSPASGKVIAVNRGEKRALLSVVVEADRENEVESFKTFDDVSIANLSREEVLSHLLNGGLWPTIRQRPFSKIADPKANPKSIFIHAMNTEPLAPDLDFILEGQEENFQTGINIIKTLTQGDVNLCVKQGSQSKALTQSQNVKIYGFTGPHPAGNVSIHIHYIDPINKGDVVWYIEAQDVLRIAALFLEGAYPTERVVAITGQRAKSCIYVKTHVGASLTSILEDSNFDSVRLISGSILTGVNVGKDGFLGFYDSQISIIPEGGTREFLGWLMPGFNKYTFSKAYASTFFPKKEYSLDTDKNGSDRAIVLNHIYDELVPLDILIYFLIRAVVSGDIDEAEKLGILECDEEDFALCTFACPSKTDVGLTIKEGLDLIEREG